MGICKKVCWLVVEQGPETYHTSITELDYDTDIHTFILHVKVCVKSALLWFLSSCRYLTCSLGETHKQDWQIKLVIIMYISQPKMEPNKGSKRLYGTPIELYVQKHLLEFRNIKLQSCKNSRIPCQKSPFVYILNYAKGEVGDAPTAWRRYMIGKGIYHCWRVVGCRWAERRGNPRWEWCRRGNCWLFGTHQIVVWIHGQCAPRKSYNKNIW